MAAARAAAMILAAARGRARPLVPGRARAVAAAAAVGQQQQQQQQLEQQQQQVQEQVQEQVQRGQEEQEQGRAQRLGRAPHEPRAHPPALVRDFVRRSLYDPAAGYFPSQAPVGALSAPLDFGALAGRDAYEAVVGGAYARLGSAWLTPAEIFRPWYGYAIGEYLVHLWESEEAGFRGHPMRVYEVGGGRGTAARDVLDYIRAAAPHLYADMRMTSVEVAPPLAAAQRRAVAAAPDGHAHKHAVLEGDASDPELWGGRDEAPCAVVALEVFDNLVHDKITRVRGEWHEALVEETLVPAGVQGGSRVQRAERTRPLQDERIRRVLELREDIRPATGGIRMERLFRWEESVWLPTGCLQLLRTLHERRCARTRARGACAHTRKRARAHALHTRKSACVSTALRVRGALRALTLYAFGLRGPIPCAFNRSPWRARSAQAAPRSCRRRLLAPAARRRRGGRDGARGRVQV